jgi:hypothetical protein
MREVVGEWILRQPGARGGKQRELSFDALAVEWREIVGEDGAGQSFARSGRGGRGGMSHGDSAGRSRCAAGEGSRAAGIGAEKAVRWKLPTRCPACDSICAAWSRRRACRDSLCSPTVCSPTIDSAARRLIRVPGCALIDDEAARCGQPARADRLREGPRRSGVPSVKQGARVRWSATMAWSRAVRPSPWHRPRVSQPLGAR